MIRLRKILARPSLQPRPLAWADKPFVLPGIELLAFSIAQIARNVTEADSIRAVAMCECSCQGVVDSDASGKKRLDKVSVSALASSPRPMTAGHGWCPCQRQLDLAVELIYGRRRAEREDAPETLAWAIL